jgi:hypothetical protein
MNKKVQLIQRFLIDNNYKFYLITNNDIHLNESPNLFQKDIYNISGFDCSHGYLLIFIDRIVFFTDSRYTLAASKFFPKSIKVYDLRNKSLSKYIIALGAN